MSREIKFRTWDTRLKKMIYDANPLINIDGVQWYIPNEWNSDDHENDIAYLDGVDMVITARRGMLMQYTGMKDKNGVEVFEGDIINLRNISYIVCYCSIEARYQLYDKVHNIYKQICSQTDGHLYNVIGNIHENGDLL